MAVVIPKNDVKNYLLQLQNSLCDGFSKLENRSNFHEDIWQHAAGGGGRTRILQGGDIFEQAGVNFSEVYGEKLPATATASRPALTNCRYHAMGVSVVVHPNNPYVPTMHANIRFFTAEKADANRVWWFGGGYDLTPYYGFVEDCRHWHEIAAATCEPFGAEIYPEFKKWADDYLYLKHRQEARGIGGIFFDDLNRWDFSRCFDFIKNVGDSILSAYLPIVERRKNHPYGERQKYFQQYRRGRYVEFNLIYDRGTLFGLQSGGRTEAILMSLPPSVAWRYNWHPELGSEEAALYQHFLPPRDWLKS